MPDEPIPATGDRLDDSAEPEVRYAVADGVATITFNRPRRLNSMTNESMAIYRSLLDRAGSAADVGAIVITGTGSAFCAGADLGELEVADANSAQAARASEWPQALATRIPKPVIAAINGAVAGLGLVEAATCDLRFASPDAIFTLAFSRYGLTAEGGISWLLPRIVGTGRALDLLWTSKRFTGADAYRFGLVEYLSEPGNALADAHAYAARLVAQVSAYSLAKMKEQVYADWGHDRDRALEASWRLVLESLDRPEFREAARPPR